MADVFISYSRQDVAFVRRLFAALEGHGLESWVDWDSIPYSADWWREICRGIDAADVLVFVISPDSLASKICNEELSYARANHKRILPIMHRPVQSDGKLLPDIIAAWFDQAHESAARDNWEHLSRLNWLFFRDSDDFNAALSGLTQAARQNPEHLRLHTRLLIRAREWEQHPTQDAGLLLRGDDLREAERWLLFSAEADPAPTPLHRRYIQVSLEQREREAQRERRNRRILRALVVVLSVLLVVALAATGFAINREQDAQVSAATAIAAVGTSDANLRQAWQTQALFLTDLGRQQLNGGRTQTALNLGLEALAHADDGIYNAESHQLLIDALATTGQLDMTYTATAPVTQAEWVADGREILAVAGDQVLRLDAASGMLIAQVSASGEVNWLYPLNAGFAVALEAGFALYTTGQPTPSATGSLPGGRLALLSDSEGHFIAIAADGSAQVWDGSAVIALAAPPASAPLSRLFSRYAASAPLFADADGGLWAFDDEQAVAGAAPWQRIAQHDAPIMAAEASPDGSLLLTAAQDGLLRLWSVGSGALLREIAHGDVNVTDAAWSPDGRVIAVYTYRDLEGVETPESPGGIWLYDAESGRLLRRLTLPERLIMSVQWLDDVRLIAHSTTGREASIWNRETGERLATLDAGGRLLQVLHSGDLLITTTLSADNTPSLVRVWRAQDGSLLNTFSQSGWVSSVEWDEERRWLTFSSESGLRVGSVDADLREMTPVAQLEQRSPLDGYRWSDDGSRLLLWNEAGDVQIWRMESALQPLRQDRPGRVNGVHFSPAGDALLVSDFAGSAALFDAQTGALRFEVRQGESITAADWRGDGQQFITWDWDMPARVWDAASGEALFSLDDAPARLINGAAWSPDQQRILTWASDDWVMVWDAQNGGLLAAAQGSSSSVGVSAAAWSPDSQRFLTWADDSATLDVWDAASGTRLFSLLHTAQLGLAHAWSPDGSRIAAACDDGSVYLWNAVDGQQIARLAVESSLAPRAVAWSPDGLLLIRTSGSVQVWDADAERERWRFDPPSGPVWSAGWSDDGAQVIVHAGRYPGMIYTLDTSSGALRLSIPHEGAPSALDWRHDGSAFAARADDEAAENRLLIWWVDVDSVLAAARSAARIPLSADERRAFFLPAGADG